MLVFYVGVTVRAFGFSTRRGSAVHAVLNLALVADRSGVGLLSALEASGVYHVLEGGEPELQQVLLLAQVVVAQVKTALDMLRRRLAYCEVGVELFRGGVRALFVVGAPQQNARRLIDVQQPRLLAFLGARIMLSLPDIGARHAVLGPADCA